MENNSRKKKCSKCGQDKWLKDYNLSKKGVLGRQSWCKDCQKNRKKVDYHKLADLYNKEKEAINSTIWSWVITPKEKIDNNFNLYAYTVNIFIDIFKVDKDTAEYFIYKLKNDCPELKAIKKLKKVKIKQCYGSQCKGDYKAIDKFYKRDLGKHEDVHCIKCQVNRHFMRNVKDDNQTELEFENGKDSSESHDKKTKEILESKTNKGDWVDEAGRDMIGFPNIPLGLTRDDIDKEDSDYNEYSGVEVTPITVDYPEREIIEVNIPKEIKEPGFHSKEIYNYLNESFKAVFHSINGLFYMAIITLIILMILNFSIGRVSNKVDLLNIKIDKHHNEIMNQNINGKLEHLINGIFEELETPAEE